MSSKIIDYDVDKTLCDTGWGFTKGTDRTTYIFDCLKARKIY